MYYLFKATAVLSSHSFCSQNKQQTVRDHNIVGVGTKTFTVLKDPFHVEAVGGAGLVIGAPLQVIRQFASTRVIDDTRVSCTDSICEKSG